LPKTTDKSAQSIDCENGDADVLELNKIEIPKLQVGQALVKIYYAGVNFINVTMRCGWCSNPLIPTPFTLGVVY
jgi:NADPH:quinone reductase